VFSAQKIDNLLVVGRCISTTHEAQAAIRMISPCYATGEAAGPLAAEAIEEKVPPRIIDVSKLQKVFLKKRLFAKSSRLTKYLV